MMSKRVPTPTVKVASAPSAIRHGLHGLQSHLNERTGGVGGGNGGSGSSLTLRTWSMVSIFLILLLFLLVFAILYWMYCRRHTKFHEIALTPVGTTTTGVNPAGMAISHCGKYLFVANNNNYGIDGSDSVTVI